MTADKSLIAKTAREIRDLLKSGEVTPVDLLDTLEDRVSEVDGTINALPTTCFEKARDEAKALADKPADQRGMLQGMPVAIKDLVATKDVLTTNGSPIFADNIPEESDILVQILEDNGGVVYAKSNTPEFGAGANTFNEVFGYTVNPWNTSRSVAGSSGGSAAALASGTAWIASDSDLGGSLRNPASFCSIVGMRPSPGRCAHGPAPLPWRDMPVQGPMARNVPDVALMLDAMVGQHPVDPISLAKPETSFEDAVAARKLPKKIAFSKDFGVTPVDSEVAAIVEKAARRFEDLGVIVEEAHPEFTDLQHVFQTHRALSFATAMQPLLENHKDKLKPEVIWNIEKGLNLSMEDVARAELNRTKIYNNMVAFMNEYDLLLSPATIVAPYSTEHRYVEELNGHTFSNYIEWCSIAYAITVTSCPAVSVPAGFTSANLPIGMQIVGKPRGEADLLSAAALYEETSGLASMVPIDPRISDS